MIAPGSLKNGIYTQTVEVICKKKSTYSHLFLYSSSNHGIVVRQLF